MEGFMDNGKKSDGMSKIFIAAAVIGALAVGGILVGLYLLPSQEEEKQAVLENAYREGSPEFEKYTKEIVITTDPNRLIEASTGLGDIIMQIGGSIYNRGDRTVTGLEVSVGMINSKNELIRDKKVLIIPEKYPALKPKEEIDISVNVPGFEPNDDRANARWKVTAIRFGEN